jgi:hypothetical protein
MDQKHIIFVGSLREDDRPGSLLLDEQKKNREKIGCFEQIRREKIRSGPFWRNYSEAQQFWGQVFLCFNLYIHNQRLRKPPMQQKLYIFIAINTQKKNGKVRLPGSKAVACGHKHRQSLHLKFCYIHPIYHNK